MLMKVEAVLQSNIDTPPVRLPESHIHSEGASHFLLFLRVSLIYFATVPMGAIHTPCAGSSAYSISFRSMARRVVWKPDAPIS